MPESILKHAEEVMQKANDSLQREFKRLKSGKATPDIVEHIRVDYYGTETPLSQLANISTPEPRILVIKAFDNGALADIEKAIIRSDIGINPQNDGKIIRLSVPPLTEETRKKLVTETKKILENAKISTRNARRDANKSLETMCKDKAISEDQRDSTKSKMQDLTTKFERILELVQKEKEQDLLKV